MRYDTTTFIKNIKGENTENAFGDFIVNVLLNGFNDKTSGEEKTKAFQLALRVQAAVDARSHVSLTQDEVSRIKKAAEPITTVLSQGRLTEYFDSPLPEWPA